MAAVVCWGIGEPGKVEEIQVEPPKSSEIRVKMLYASVCHTDILFAKGFLIVSIHIFSFFNLCVSIYFSFTIFFFGQEGLMLLHVDLQPLFPRVLGHEGVG